MSIVSTMFNSILARQYLNILLSYSFWPLYPVALCFVALFSNYAIFCNCAIQIGNNNFSKNVIPTKLFANRYFQFHGISKLCKTIHFLEWKRIHNYFIQTVKFEAKCIFHMLYHALSRQNHKTIFQSIWIYFCLLPTFQIKINMALIYESYEKLIDIKKTLFGNPASNSKIAMVFQHF